MMWADLTREQRREHVAHYISEGLSSSQIGDQLGTTKNAIIAFCRRQGLKLPGGTQPARHRSAPKPTAVVIVETNTAITQPDAEPVPFLEAIDRRLCKWPLWDAFTRLEDALCCGAPRRPGRPYCEFHESIHQGAGTWQERNALQGLERVLR